MSESDHIHGSDEEKDQARKHLRGLKKHKAPWYFDAQLQQRLRRNRSAGFLSRPIPSYALSMLAIIGIGVVSYYTLFDTTPSNQEQSTTQQGKETERRESQTRPLNHQNTEPHKDQTIDQSSQVSQTPPRGPSGPNKDATIESHVEVTPGGDKTTSFQRGLQQPTQGDPQPAYEANLAVDSSRTTKEDSLSRAKADSLKLLEKDHR
jgi:hypothetical protein